VGTNLLKEDRQGANLDAMDEMWAIGKPPCGPTSLVESCTPQSRNPQIHFPDVHLETMHPFSSDSSRLPTVIRRLIAEKREI
jgi:hypothetical protein